METEKINEQASSMVVEGGEWVRITFAETPGHAILDALKGSGFYWRSGSWWGWRANIPAEVQSA